MYIEETTAAERLVIRQAVDNSFNYVMRARRMLMRILTDYFESAEQEPINRTDAEDMGDILHAINDALWQAETEYSLTVGDEAAPGCPSSYEGAKRAIFVRDVERLYRKLGRDAPQEYLNMDDEKALPILQELLSAEPMERGVLV